MNCFQNFIYIWPDTTLNGKILLTDKLWIAFKILFIFDLTQQRNIDIGTFRRCELLSKFYLYLTWHNDWKFFAIIPAVVNCFQNFIYIWPDTTHSLESVVGRLSWGIWVSKKNYTIAANFQIFGNFLFKTTRVVELPAAVVPLSCS